ncbi:MAG TPA: hypothetical protein ENI34_05430 [candidate division WOR-3 bacterium]|uniref:ARG and Rhodanese-Phosphatase-superfamily-associated domain-containing protein n=1 Tax=candidate division WOR-3 bacterium TaxID=2052148 RepID=A0A9C9EMP1_UNCW3|nr:hypothetical protein [candidate division WOR-3 bacterium]
MDVNLHLAEPVFLRNLMVFPIRTPKSDNGIELNSIDEILSSGSARFMELDSPEINEVVFENRSDTPVLMLDGEEITGSLQNRIITMSGVVDARSSKNIPVVCVEGGRWQELGKFNTGCFSYPRLRSLLTKSRYSKIDLQKTVWKEIERKLTVTRTRSMTSSMHEIYDNLQEEISRYVEDFTGLNHNTVGLISTAGRQILGCDIFFNNRLYKKYEFKLLRSYALDALEYMQKGGNRDNVRTFLNALEDMLRRITFKKRNINKVIKNNILSGQLLFHAGRMIHLSAFPV